MSRLIALFGLLIVTSAARADSVATIELQSRPAAEVIPIVEPMLGASDAISGDGYIIFLRSSPETLARVKSMIDALDVPARTLLVSVFQGSSRDLGALGISAEIDIQTGDTTYSTNDSQVSVDAIATKKGLTDKPVHQVRVIEGNEAYIETGQQIPFFSGTAWVGRKGVVGGVEYQTVSTGFYVTPRTRGDNVTFDVSPFKNALSETGGGRVDTQSASTTVTGRAGEWLLIGGATTEMKHTQSGIASHASTQGREQTGVWIRADFVD
ncbi:MAG: hypothetical protein QNJ07_02480 [Woeseiaceae bacterium]|nr:hypothetical protein [Woeseiaceae bacterium]